MAIWSLCGCGVQVCSSERRSKHRQVPIKHLALRRANHARCAWLVCHDWNAHLKCDDHSQKDSGSVAGPKSLQRNTEQWVKEHNSLRRNVCACMSTHWPCSSSLFISLILRCCSRRSACCWMSRLCASVGGSGYMWRTSSRDSVSDAARTVALAQW